VADLEHPFDSMRKGVAPRTAPSFREERMTRVRCTESNLLVVWGGEATELVDDMFEENVIEKHDSAGQRRNKSEQDISQGR